MLTLFPRIRANPMMPPPAPAEATEVAASVTGEEATTEVADTTLVASPGEIDDVAAAPAADEASGATSTDAEAREASPETGFADPVGGGFVTEEIAERHEIDSSLIEAPEMVAAFLSSLHESTKNEVAEPVNAADGATTPEIAIAATNIFDEIEILHEVDGEVTPVGASAPVDEHEPRVALDDVIAATRDANHAVETAPAPDVKPEAEVTEASGEVVAAAEPLTAESSANEALAEQIAAEEAPQETVARDSMSMGEVVADISDAATAESGEIAVGATDKLEAPAVIARPATGKRPEGLGFFNLERVPEPEAMEDSGEVEAYASAAAQAHLDAIDDTFVAHAQLLLKGKERGRALDIGTGPGQIVLKLGYQLTRWKFVGVDRSVAMIEKAREGLASAPELAGRVEFQVADGNELEFPSASFDLVVCNSVLHHLAKPQNLFSEIARVVKPNGAILLRDLRRPARFEFSGHVRKHGKHYKGEMKWLYVASVQAAYTPEELEKMVVASKLRGVRIFRHGKTHIGFERTVSDSVKRIQ